MRDSERTSLSELERAIERADLAKEAAGIGIHDYDIQTGRILWDRRVHELWGVPLGTEVDYQTFTNGVHPDDLPSVEEAVTASQDPTGGGRYYAEYRVRNASDGKIRFVEASGRTIFRDGVPIRLVGTVRDVTAEREVRDELRHVSQFAQGLVNTSAALLYIFDLVEQRNVFIGPQIVEMTGMVPSDYAELGGELLPVVIHPDDLERVRDHHRSIREGRQKEPFQIDYRLRRTDGSWVWLASSEVVHAVDAKGFPTQILGASMDISRRYEAAEVRELLVKELAHRVKNTFAMVQSVASLTLKKSCDPEAWNRFEGRLTALAAGHVSVGPTGSGTVSLKELVDTSTQPFMNRSLQTSGPDCEVAATTADALPLILHELGTNAIKYGAWSAEHGQVRLTWDRGDSWVTLTWAERGGPTVRKPSRIGFGRRLLAGAASSIGGRLIWPSTQWD